MSQIKDKQTMKSGQLIEYNVKNVLNHEENKADRLVPALFLPFKKVLY